MPAPHDAKEMARLDARIVELQNELILLMKQQAGTHKQLLDDNGDMRKTVTDLIEMWDRAVTGEATAEDYLHAKALRTSFGVA